MNDSFEVGWPHVPDIVENVLKTQFNLVNAVSDISNFYTNNHLDIKGALLTDVFMQSPDSGYIYPTLDPDVNRPLEIYLYRGSKFGFVDSGSLACLAKSKLTDLYNENYPSSIHKLPPEQLKQVKEDLIASYVDDLCLGTTLSDIESCPTPLLSTVLILINLELKSRVN